MVRRGSFESTASQCLLLHPSYVLSDGKCLKPGGGVLSLFLCLFLDHLTVLTSWLLSDSSPTGQGRHEELPGEGEHVERQMDQNECQGQTVARALF